MSSKERIARKAQRYAKALAFSIGAGIGALALVWTPLVYAQTMPDAAAPATISAETANAPAALTAPAAPLLVAPTDNAITTGDAESAPPLGMPLLSWQPVPGADRYQVQISTSPGFASTIVDVSTYATKYAPAEAIADGEYYWRVRAIEGREWGQYSDVRSFTKDWSAGGTILPQLESPLEGAQISAFSNDHFSWGAIPGAAYYLFEISTDRSFSAVVYSANTIKAHHTSLTRLANNTYFWRVTPVDHEDHHGQPSVERTFTFAWDTPPALLGPDDNVDTPFLPQFSWTAVEAAHSYLLEIDTQSDFASPNQYLTANTDFTPEQTLSNDQDYYWRVKAIDNQGNSTPWSDHRRFRIRWNFRPTLLTPLNTTNLRSYPFFSWTPVPGVERYQIQIDKSTSFANPIADEKIYNATTYAHPDWKEALMDSDYFWRVQGLDAEGNSTGWSTIYSFRVSYTTTPNPIYPPYYYTPDAENLPVHDDPTIAWPLFVWDTAHSFDADLPDAVDLTIPDYYELTVSSDLAFQTINFQIETAGLAAAPTQAHPFVNLQDGHDYYWRVRAKLEGGAQIGTDVVWRTRIDRTVPQLAETETITIIYPQDRFEAVEAAPVLGWQPVQDAHHYRVQVSHNAAFTDIAEEAIAQFVNYVPWQSQRTPIPTGVYWWRVRAEDAQNQAIGDWSETRRFHVSLDLVTGNPYDLIPPDRADGLPVALGQYDPDLTLMATSPRDANEPSDLGNLHVMMDRVYNGNFNWVVAFEAAASVTGTVEYALYIDIDHIEGQGASTDPQGRSITVDPLYLPEYVLYITRTDNTVEPQSVLYFQWMGTNWGPGQTLTLLGGDAWFAANSGAVHLLIPYTALGVSSEEFVGSLALAVLSTGPSPGGALVDSVPVQKSNTPWTLNQFIFVSDMLMPLYPFDTPLSNPMVLHEMPPMRWRMPYFDSVDGYQVQVARDVHFTDLVETWETFETSRWRYFGLLPATFQSLAVYGDNESYYWRVRIRHERYMSNQNFYDYGPWSPAMRFKLQSRQVGNPAPASDDLAQSADNQAAPAAALSKQATPTFTWDRVQGAAGYVLQVDDDANFSRPIINEKLDGTSYTPLDPLPDGLYYWRVTMRRSDKVFGQWTPTMSFVKESLAPTPLAPINNEVVTELPTFRWEAVLTDTPDLRTAAPRYQIQIDDDPNFSDPDTFQTESTALTVSKEKRLRRNKMMDGTWYWRVAVIDADRNVGAYSPTQQFAKEYQRPSILSPLPGEDPAGSSFQTPVFTWVPLTGAAYYEIRIAETANAVDSARPVQTDNTSYVPTKDLDLLELHWKVQMFDDEGVPGPTTDGSFYNELDVLHLPFVQH